MKIDDDSLVEFRVFLPDRTVAWLCELADACHQHPATVIASILNDVCDDDEATHMVVVTHIGPTTIN